MPAKDLYHDAVKSALMKAGWVIVADPYRIQDKDFDWYTQQTDIRPIAAAISPTTQEHSSSHTGRGDCFGGLTQLVHKLIAEYPPSQ